MCRKTTGSVRPLSAAYREDYAVRTAANYVGIWANARHEVIYFVTTRDADGKPLNGDSKYVIDFPAQDQPDNVTNAYWSLSLVNVPGYLGLYRMTLIGILLTA